MAQKYPYGFNVSTPLDETSGEGASQIVKGRAFGSPLARGLYPRASTAEVDPRASPGPRPPWKRRP